MRAHKNDTQKKKNKCAHKIMNGNLMENRDMDKEMGGNAVKKKNQSNCNSTEFECTVTTGAESIFSYKYI